MDKFAKRVEKLISRSNDLLTDHLLTKISFALTFCRLAEQHSGEEQLDQLHIASRIYDEVDEFSHRRESVLSQELVSTMNHLWLELQKFGQVSQPGIPETSNAVAFQYRQR